MKTLRNTSGSLLLVLVMFVSAFVFGKDVIENKSPEVITLEEDNTIVLNEDVTEESIHELMLEITMKLDSLKKNPVVYLVLNTNGGEVRSGIKFISFLKSLKIEVKTISIKSVSMGFHIVQNLGERLITENGYMMSHQMWMRVPVVELPVMEHGRLGAELKQTKRMDEIASKRMKISYENYLNLIASTFNVYGKDAVKMNSADRVIRISCGKSYKNPLDCPIFL